MGFFPLLHFYILVQAFWGFSSISILKTNRESTFFWFVCKHKHPLDTVLNIFIYFFFSIFHLCLIYSANKYLNIMTSQLGFLNVITQHYPKPSWASEVAQKCCLQPLMEALLLSELRLHSWLKQLWYKKEVGIICANTSLSHRICSRIRESWLSGFYIHLWEWVERFISQGQLATAVSLTFGQSCYVWHTTFKHNI